MMKAKGSQSIYDCKVSYLKGKIVKYRKENLDIFRRLLNLIILWFNQVEARRPDPGRERHRHQPRHARGGRQGEATLLTS